MNTNEKGFASTQKATVGSRQYIDLSDLIGKEPKLLNYDGFIPYMALSLEMLIKHRLEGTDCIYTIDCGETFIPMKNRYDKNELIFECDYIMHIENPHNSKILDIYFDVANDDGSHELSICLFDPTDSLGLQANSMDIQCNPMMEEIAEYIQILIANHSGLKVSDKHVKDWVKNSVSEIEMSIRLVLMK